MSAIKTHKFPNGLLLVLEKLPKSRSCGVAVGFPAGGRNEKPEISGISHYLEHLIFKGTDTIRNIDKAFEQVGAVNNAFTEDDSTVYLAECPRKSGIKVLELWLHALAEASIDQAEFERERGVILSEYFLTEDNPEYLVEKNANLSLFNGHPLASTVIGSEETIKAISHEDMISYYRCMYHPANSVIWVSGDFALDDLVECVEKHESWSQKTGAPAVSYQTLNPRSVPTTEIRRQTTLTQVCLAFSSPTESPAERASLQIFSSMLSSGRSSLLRQKLILEGNYTDRFLTTVTSYKEAGIFSTSFAVEPSKALGALGAVASSIRGLSNTEGVEENFKRAKNHALGLSSAEIDRRMMLRTITGAWETLRRGHCSWDERDATLESLAFDQFQENILKVTHPNRIALVLAGNFEEGITKGTQWA